MKLCEVAIFTDQVDAVADFYQRLLHREPQHRGEGIAIFQFEGSQVLVHKRYTPRPEDPPCENHTAYSVVDLDRTVTELAERGITVEILPREYPWGRSAYLRDPAGHLLELHEEA